MNSIKIIFLDVDGVLNSNSTHERCGCSLGIDEDKVSLLKTIVDQTDAKIVLVSTWKYWWFKETEKKKDQDEYANLLDLKLKKYGLAILDKTSNDIEGRGQGIVDYINSLKDKNTEVSRFIIIDDEIFDYKKHMFTSHLIQTGFYGGGLQWKHVLKAIDKLGG